MNPEEVRLCACGARPEKGATLCISCGAGLPPPADVDAPRQLVEENATAPMMATGGVTDSGRTYAIGAVFGSYRLVKQIGIGGMGHVFIAQHTRLGRQVAVKILRSEYSENREAVRRFFAEAQAVNRINHENIIEVTDFIESPHGPSLYVMELLKGQDLRALEDSVGVLPLRRALGIVMQVCKALSAAHDAGIVHRDLKPDNIFLTERQGRPDFVKLLDFGVAKLMNATLDDASSFKSMAGIVVGTPAYMAPEQAMGQTVDHRADIYSVGVILFELATGQRPFVADSAREIMAKHMMATPPRPNKLRGHAEAIPNKLEDLILACLKKEARDRPQSIKEIEQRLRDVLEDLPDEDTAVELRRPASRRRLWLGGAALIALGAMAVVAAHAIAPSKATVAARAETSAASSTGAPAAPAALPVPVAPAPKVDLTFVSTPPGAAVFRAGAEQPLGVTPFSATFDETAQPETFEFHLDGWQVGRRLITLSQSDQVAMALVPVNPSPSLAAIAEPPPRKLPAGKHQGATPAKRTVSEPAPTAAPKSDPLPPKKLDSDVVLNPFE